MGNESQEAVAIAMEKRGNGLSGTTMDCTTVNGATFETAPLLSTSTAKLRALLNKLTGTVAVSARLDTKVVVRGIWSSRTTDVFVNVPPVTVSVTGVALVKTIAGFDCTICSALRVEPMDTRDTVALP